MRSWWTWSCRVPNARREITDGSPQLGRARDSESYFWLAIPSTRLLGLLYEVVGLGVRWFVLDQTRRSESTVTKHDTGR